MKTEKTDDQLGKQFKEIAAKLGGDEKLASQMLGTIMMKIMLRPTEEREQIVKNLQNPVFVKGVEFGIEIVTSIMEILMDNEELKDLEKLR